MTTTVIVQAHCSNDTEVVLTLHTNGLPTAETILQDGESAENYVYDDREISVRERIKRK